MEEEIVIGGFVGKYHYTMMGFCSNKTIGSAPTSVRLTAVTKAKIVFQKLLL